MDLFLLGLVNGYAGDNILFDQTIDHISNNYLFKGAVPLLFFWYFWARENSETAARRRKLVALLITAIAAIGLGRGLALFLPFRFRPIADPDVALNIPTGEFNPPLSAWSSFPSDHAVMFFTIAVAFAWISRPASALLLLHALIVVSLPRIFLGLHWPSDIAAGAAAGAVLAAILMPVSIRLIDAVGVERVPPKSLAMPILVLITLETATMFSASRGLLGALAKALALV